MDPMGCRHLVALPWPGRGHINPMMNLCKRLVHQDPNLLVTFVVTEEWLGFMKSDSKPDKIHFATLPNLIPSEHVRANDFLAFIDAVYTRLEEPFERLLDQLTPTVILADTYLVWAVRIGARRNIPVASFWTTSATILSLFLHSDLLATHGHFPIDMDSSSPRKEDEVVDYIPGLAPTRIRDLPQIYHGFSYQLYMKFKPCFDELSKANYLLFPSAYELEPKAVDFFTSHLDFPVYTTGPLIPFGELGNDGTGLDYIQWLDEQPEGSVLYISQGSFLSASEAEMDKIVGGVRESGVRFLWVARGAESRLKEVLGDSSGLVVSWCDQLRVLCHAAVGGFWTHCGYNSTLEGLYSGVPMLTSPLLWDQFLNSKMIVDEWRIGTRIESKEMRREEIKEVVKRFMDRESEKGKEMTRRACELSNICRRVVSEGGSSDVGIHSFIKDLTKIV